MSKTNENKNATHCEESDQKSSKELSLANRRRTESEDSGISVTNTEDEMKKNENGNEVLKDVKQSLNLIKKLKNCLNDEKILKDNSKQNCKKLSGQRVQIEKIDKEQSSKKNNKEKGDKSKIKKKLIKDLSDQNVVLENGEKLNRKSDQELDQKSGQNLKKKTYFSVTKTQIKSLKDVEKLLSKTRKSIVIPQSLAKKLVFVPEFDKVISFNLVEKKLNDLANNLDNVKETLILSNKQLNHLSFAKSSQTTNSKNIFNVLIELASDQQVDLTIKKLNNLNKELNVIKILEKCKKINQDNDLKKENLLDESEFDLGTRKFRSNTYSNHQISIESKLKYNKKRNSLDASVVSASSNGHRVNIPRNGHLIREPFGPGLNNFETRLKRVETD